MIERYGHGMFGRQRQLVFDVLAAALDDPDPGGGWLHGLDIAERCGVRSGSSFPILLTACERGDVLRDPNRDPDRPGLVHYRLTDQGVRRRQRDAVPRRGLLRRLLRPIAA